MFTSTPMCSTLQNVNVRVDVEREALNTQAQSPEKSLNVSNVIVFAHCMSHLYFCFFFFCAALACRRVRVRVKRIAHLSS